MHITLNSSPNSGGCELSMNGNEMVLLLASGGTLCHCFIRMLSAAAVLSSSTNTDRDDIDLCVIGLIHSLVTVVPAWQMTSFLLSIPRRTIESRRQLKFTLACLINIIVMCGTGWLVLTLDNKSTYPSIEMLYFGSDAGYVTGALLEPFVDLYKLHTAMSAYEFYKEQSPVFSCKHVVSTRYGSLSNDHESPINA